MGKKAKEKVKKQYEEELKAYISKTISEYVDLVPIIRLYLVHWMDQPHNDKGSSFSMTYNPEIFSASFYIYQDIFREIPDEGLTRGFRDYIRYCLAHEFGHCLIWELDGKSSTIEKAATLIGTLLMRLHEYVVPEV
ncbi:MAG: hypothetical protein DRO05_00850 [Thermoproteota archaeon]|nr:MAG: hypothetical protein DRO05_00850 [Candidatus Korarchaeota archaeon]